jgi:hypothetical protein
MKPAYEMKAERHMHAAESKSRLHFFSNDEMSALSSMLVVYLLLTLIQTDKK